MYKLSRLNIYDIHSYQIAEFIYAYFNKLLPTSFSNFFHLNKSIHSHYTRSSNNLHCIFSKTDFCARSIKVAGPKLWNSLPDDIKNCPSKFVFKRMLKELILKSYVS